MLPSDARDFRLVQHEFTAWLRHPESAAVPAGIEARRLAIYRELLFNNVTSFVEITYPVAQALLPEALWSRLTSGFFADHACISPLFTDISLHFREYVASLDWPELADHPWLTELLHFEWMELVADIDDYPLTPAAERIGGELLDAANPLLALAGPAWPLAYQWPVQRWNGGTDVASLVAEPACLLAFRRHDAELSLAVLTVSPAAAFLIEQLQQHDAPLALDALAATLCQASPGLAADAACAMIRDILRDLASHGLCFRRPDHEPNA